MSSGSTTPMMNGDDLDRPADLNSASQGKSFDLAEDIRRICNPAAAPSSEGLIDKITSLISGLTADGAQSVGASARRSSQVEFKATPEPLASDSDTPALPQSNSINLFSPLCLQQLAESVARFTTERTALLVLSPSGNVVESGQCGWRSSEFRSHLPELTPVARESLWSKSGHYAISESDWINDVEAFQKLQFQPSLLLSHWTQKLGDCAIAVKSFPLQESRGNCLMICSVESSTSRERFAKLCESKFEHLVNQVDAWYAMRRNRKFSRWFAIVDWMVSNPRWCAIPVALMILLMTLPIPYFPKRECVIEPEAKQFVASPIQGRIAACNVRPGDFVNKGELLATIDDDQMQRDLATAKAEFESAKQKANAALANKASSNYSLAMLECEQAQLKIDSIQNQLDRLEIRTPVTGVVIYGDLQKSIGMPVNLGQNLFEVAELGLMTAEVRLSAYDLEQISVGDSVTVRSDATGFQAFHGKILRIDPRATVIDNEAVFVADVLIRDSEAGLRPGMKASARIGAGWRTLGWLLFHRPVQWLSQQWVW
ncbi:MAG: efflux RND transporter periplasmic adaptor subunit [Pirellula sp.]|jgi:hypothetical protein